MKKRGEVFFREHPPRCTTRSERVAAAKSVGKRRVFTDWPKKLNGGAARDPFTKRRALWRAKKAGNITHRSAFFSK
jgi:hypothetical protein